MRTNLEEIEQVLRTEGVISHRRHGRAVRTLVERGRAGSGTAGGLCRGGQREYRANQGRRRWRQNLLILDGWCVLRFTYTMLSERPAEVLEMIRSALAMLEARI